LLDANVIHALAVCDTICLLRERDVFALRWSDEIMREADRSLLRRGKDASRRLADMQAAFEDADVSGYESLIPALRCDEGDRHVLAAAIVGEAEQIVTFNVRHFPPESVQPFAIEVVTPDELLLNALEHYPRETLAAIRQQARDARKPPLKIADVLRALRKDRVTAFADAIEPLLTKTS